MNDWQSTYLGRGALPRDLSGFEIEAFFTYSEPERRVIDDERRTPALKLALALQIGFLRMTGRLLEALRMVPPVLLNMLVPNPKAALSKNKVSVGKILLTPAKAPTRSQAAWKVLGQPIQ